ncbi:MAG: TIGR02266 family protein [Desulfuromonadales bacterium]|nr:TIGR02266 family protein [Desulfuromonadales bacterium]
MPGKKCVLLADDGRPFLEIMRTFLRREKVAVIVAESGAEALARARSHRPDLIVLDLQMPEMDGDVCCRRLKSDPELASVPVLLVTGGNLREEAERCWLAGCDAVIAKPLTRENFLTAVRRFLHRSEPAGPRVQMRLPVRYGIDRHNVLRHYTVNLSTGGLFLETPIVLPVETLVTLEIALPAAEQPVSCKGRIAWVNAPGRRAKPGYPPGLGLQFLDLVPRDAMRMQQFVQAESAALLSSL